MMAHSLPRPEAEALFHSQQLVSAIHQELSDAGGWISFQRYMQLALYAPSLGYYSGGAKKFGQSGDFVTAPEISGLFARTLARQIAQIVEITSGDVLELGAGTGKLAAALLLELEQLQQLPNRYYILEVSADLRAVQQTTIKALPAALQDRVQWLDYLPQSFDGVILGNEVLDAIPVQIARNASDGLQELGVVWRDEAFAWEARPAGVELAEFVQKLDLQEGYTIEVNHSAGGLVASLAALLGRGLVLLIDYGFPRREYYHPQRHQGTLMCHYRHYAHTDPFFYPGLQDITAHVDFTLVAEAAVNNGLQLAGYCTQAQFLINCGITELLMQVSPSDISRYAPLASEAQKLLSPAEMGELFKVIAFTKDLDIALLGFVRGDKQHTL